MAVTRNYRHGEIVFVERADSPPFETYLCDGWDTVSGSGQAMEWEQTKMTFKIGDEVTVLCCDYGHSYSIGNKYKITAITGNNIYLGGGHGGYVRATEIRLVENKKTSMTLKDSFTLAFKAEPEKSFRKAGITNGDDFLTEDGQHIFLAWLLKKHGEEFKKDVVDGLIEDLKDKKD